MARYRLFDEFHLTLFALRGLREAVYGPMHRTLSGKPFQTRLRRAILDILRQYPSLRPRRVTPFTLAVAQPPDRCQLQ